MGVGRTELLRNSDTTSEREDILPSIEVYHLTSNLASSNPIFHIHAMHVPTPDLILKAFNYHPRHESRFSARSNHFDIGTCTDLMPFIVLFQDPIVEAREGAHSVGPKFLQFSRFSYVFCTAIKWRIAHREIPSGVHFNMTLLACITS